MSLKDFTDPLKFTEGLGHDCFQLNDGSGCPDPRYDIFTLSIDEKLTVE
jgi:hypothetical protein